MFHNNFRLAAQCLTAFSNPYLLPPAIFSITEILSYVKECISWMEHSFDRHRCVLFEITEMFVEIGFINDKHYFRILSSFT